MRSPLNSGREIFGSWTILGIAAGAAATTGVGTRIASFTESLVTRASKSLAAVLMALSVGMVDLRRVAWKLSKVLVRRAMDAE